MALNDHRLGVPSPEFDPGHEGLLIGGSCGSTVAGAYRFIKENKIPKAQLQLSLYYTIPLLCFVYHIVYIVATYAYVHTYIQIYRCIICVYIYIQIITYKYIYQIRCIDNIFVMFFPKQLLS